MTFSTITLVPFNVTLTEGDLSNIEWPLTYDVPPTIGTGSLVDDSDTSGVELGGWNDAGEQHIERVTADFTTPADVSPLAVLIQIRAKNSAELLAEPLPGSRLVYQALQATVDGAILHSQAPGNTAPGNWPLGPLTVAEVTEPTTFTWYWGQHPDMSNPTDSGYWYELALDPAALAALTTDGLRVTFGWYWGGDSDIPGRRAWVDVYEIRLVVAVVASGRRYRRPLRQFPRSPLRVDANRAIQRSLRQGPGAYL